MPASKGRVLVVEDEKDLIRLIRYNLEREGYAVAVAEDGEKAIAAAKRTRPDLVVLDIMLPKLDGLEVLRRLRRETQVPVILLTAKRSEVDKILGLKLGADDYVVKPFSIGELLARIEARLRSRVKRGDAGADNAVSIGRVTVDIERHEVAVRGRKIELTPKEFELLRLLIEADGRVLSREELLEKIWGHGEDSEIDTRTVDQHIARLRRKLNTGGSIVATVTNFGYRLKRS